MIKRFITVAAFAILAHTAGAQTQVTRTGNELTAIKTSAATDTTLTRNSHLTPLTFRNVDGLTYNVYQSEGGSYYVVRTAKKSGNRYRQYLKVN